MQRQQKSFSQYLRAASLFSVVAMHQQIDLLDCIPVHGKPANLRLSLSPPFLLLPCKPNKHTFVLTSVFWWPFVCLMPAYISFNTFFCSHCLYAFVCLQRPFYRKKCTWAPSMVYSLIDLSIFSRHKHTLRKAVAMRVTPTRIALTHELPVRAMIECSEQWAADTFSSVIIPCLLFFFCVGSLLFAYEEMRFMESVFTFIVMFIMLERGGECIFHTSTGT